MREIIDKLVNRVNLTEKQMFEVMRAIMEGKMTSVQIAAIITALRIKGETVEEITGAVKAMRSKANTIKPLLEYYIDTCGTGGDGGHTFNVSTASALVAAAGGVSVAKHGNRSVSSRCGSADVLESLGVCIDLTADVVKQCIEKEKIGFMFAPLFHPSMKYAAVPRKEMGIRTIFNILGPLTNPAMAKGQMLGVYDKALMHTLAKVLQNLGTERAMLVCGEDGLDEITLTTKTNVCELKDGEIYEYQIDPKVYGFDYCHLEDLTGGDAKENANIITDILSGRCKGPKTDMVILNSAAALYIGKKANDLEEGIRMAEKIIEEGSGLQKLKVFATHSQLLKKQSTKGVAV